MMCTRHAVFFVGITSVCANAGNVQMAKGPELSRWEAMAFDVMGSRLTVNIPTRFDPDFLPPQPQFRVSSLMTEIPEERPPKEFANFHWAYFGHFWQGVVGGVGFTAFARRVPGWFHGDLRVPGNYLAMLEEKWQRSGTERQVPIASLPHDYQVLSGPGGDWIRYWYSSDLLRFETWIDANHYLVLQFDFVANNKLKTDWRTQAEKLVDRIWKSVNYERNPTGGFVVGPLK